MSTSAFMPVIGRRAKQQRRTTGQDRAKGLFMPGRCANGVGMQAVEKLKNNRSECSTNQTLNVA